MPGLEDTIADVPSSFRMMLFATVMGCSAEGHEFIVDRKCACVSKTIEAMLQGKREGDSETSSVPLSCDEGDYYRTSSS